MLYKCQLCIDISWIPTKYKLFKYTTFTFNVLLPVSAYLWYIYFLLWFEFIKLYFYYFITNMKLK